VMDGEGQLLTVHVSDHVGNADRLLRVIGLRCVWQVSPESDRENTIILASVIYRRSRIHLMVDGDRGDQYYEQKNRDGWTAPRAKHRLSPRKHGNGTTLPFYASHPGTIINAGRIFDERDVKSRPATFTSLPT